MTNNVFGGTLNFT